jgi:hypothetical protein
MKWSFQGTNDDHLGSGPEKNQESNQEKRDSMGEEARETQNDV